MFWNDVFKPLVVFPSVSGGTMVMWDLQPEFLRPGPYVFTLEYSESEVGEFSPVGPPVTNTFMSIDPVKREWNKTVESAYRVKLVAAGNEVYYSETVVPYGGWNRHDILIARDIVRKELLRASKYTGDRGWMLKRRIFGEHCTFCTESGMIEYTTGIVLSTAKTCSVCLGTGIVHGYFDPYPVVLTPQPEGYKRQLNAQMGQVQPMVRAARVLAFPQWQRGDLWFSEGSDRRYYVQEVRNAAEFRNIPVVCDIELRQAPFTDQIYSIDLGLSSL